MKLSDRLSRMRAHGDPSDAELADAVDQARADETALEEARHVARQAVAAVKAYSDELNGEPTEHAFDEIVARWERT